MFEKINQLSELKEIIAQEELSFLYITQPNCSVCHSLKPQIEKILSDHPVVRTLEVDAFEVPEVAGEYSALTAPVLLLFVKGKEYLRKARFVNTAEFSAAVEKIVTGVTS